MELTRADLAILLAITFIDGMAAVAGVIDYDFRVTNADSALIVVTDVLDNIDRSFIAIGGVETGSGKNGVGLSYAEVVRLLAIDTNADNMVALGDGDDIDHHVACGSGAVAVIIACDNDLDIKVPAIVMIDVSDPLVKIDGGIISTDGVGTGSGKTGVRLSNAEIARLLVIGTNTDDMVALGAGGDNGRDAAFNTRWLSFVVAGIDDLDIRIVDSAPAIAMDALVRINGGSGKTDVNLSYAEFARLLAIDTYAGNVALDDGDDNDRHVACGTRWHGVERRRGNGGGLCRDDHGEVLTGVNPMTFTTAHGCAADHVGTGRFMLNGASKGRLPGTAHKNGRTEGELSHQPGV